jgi:T5SS/PEP-CTERM-associated repeat protein
MLARPSYAAISTLGNVTPDPSTTTSSDNLYIGDTTAGMMLADGGSGVTSYQSYVGNGAGVIGSAIIDGEDTNWYSGVHMFVGFFGTGMLGIAHGGQVHSSYGTLGEKLGSDGTVTVNGAGSAWYNGRLFLGYEGSGALNLTNGGKLYGTGPNYLGYWAGASGTVAIDGKDSAWWGNPTYVGYYGDGMISVTNGGLVNALLSLGCFPDSSGTVTVDGGSLSSGETHLGYQGVGSFALTGAGSAELGKLHVGYYHGSTGTASISGVGSTLTCDDLYVGDYGTGTLSVTDGATVESDSWGDLRVGNHGGGNGTLNINSGGQLTTSGNVYLGYNGEENTYPEAVGEVTVDGVGSVWTNGDDYWDECEMYVGYEGTGSLLITGGGRVTNYGDVFIRQQSASVTVDGPDSTLAVLGSSELLLDDYGTLSISNGGVLDVQGTLRLEGYNGYGLSLVDGVLRVGVLQGSNQFNFTSGRLEAQLVDLNQFLVQKGGTLAPGNSAGDSIGTTNVKDRYTLDRGTVEIDLYGLDIPGVDFDQIDMDGYLDLLGSNALAEGQLKVRLGFEPAVGDEWLIVDNDGSDAIRGTFANGTTVRASYDGIIYQFAIDYTADTGNNDIALITEAVVGLVGDYNGDGSVDAADYTVWRDTEGTNVTPYTGADGDGNGYVGWNDYWVWKDYFGATAGAGDAGVVDDPARLDSQSAAVPEPQSLVLVALAAAALSMRPRRRSK